MKNVVSVAEMQQIEKRAIEAGISVETLMEQAGKETASFISNYAKAHAITLKAYIVAGTGNNGGDGYVVARYLLQDGFSVQVLQVGALDPNSLTKKQRRRYEARGGKVSEALQLPTDGVIVDALFGTGFHGTQQENTLHIIEAINQSNLPIFAVDVPSGLNADTGEVTQAAVKATFTCTMECPKLGFFFQSGWNHVGEVVSLPIGLEKFIESAQLAAVEKSDVQKLLPPIVRNRHKYTAGHVVGFSGTLQGAALMSSWAALRSGAGIVHLLQQTPGYAGGALEIVEITYPDAKTGRTWLDKASGAFIGPGFGTSPKDEALLEALLANYQGKIVLDADAITWLAKKGATFGPLPNAILTPHLGELHHFFPEKEVVSMNFLRKCQEFVDRNETNLIIKGGPSFLLSHKKTALVLMEGDPGMATAGAGDVLTGILASLLAQGLSAYNAMLLGSYLHGTAGKIAAREETSYSMTASSITAHLPHAFKEFDL
ncbi:MAG: NAD(P)H-hydrate epimerase [Verrucomicrobia bacterium]|nr:NAD(P)H-hydrate epimerase [Verrucomicrobiota bacterium]MBS0636064.1 NAD(P)H-hydrate epimerase [Verrucomicrobiota bacterium]